MSLLKLEFEIKHNRILRLMISVCQPIDFSTCRKRSLIAMAEEIAENKGTLSPPCSIGRAFMSERIFGVFALPGLIVAPLISR